MAKFREFSRDDVRALVKISLEGENKTRLQLELELGVPQQRISEALISLGASVVGHERRVGGGRGQKGRPFAIYSIQHPMGENLLKETEMTGKLGSAK